jgi:hypothetical protein
MLLGWVDTFADIGIVSAAVIGIITLMGLVVTRIIRPTIHMALEVRNWVREVNETIQRELTPNAGSSLKDTIDLLASKLDLHMADQTAHFLHQEAHNREMEGHVHDDRRHVDGEK